MGYILSRLFKRKGDNLGNLIVGDVLLLFFSIYVGIFFKKFHTDYPKMKVAFTFGKFVTIKSVGNTEIILQEIFQ